MKKVLKMVDLKTLNKTNGRMAFRRATEEIFPMRAAFADRGIQFNSNSVVDDSVQR